MTTDVNNTPKFNIGDEVLFYVFNNKPDYAIHKVTIKEITINKDGFLYRIEDKEYPETNFIRDCIREYCLATSTQELVYNLKEKALSDCIRQCENFDEAVKKFNLNIR